MTNTIRDWPDVSETARTDVYEPVIFLGERVPPHSADKPLPDARRYCYADTLDERTPARRVL
jgi:hypothetical protein